MERNEENEMLKLSEIDVNKCFIDDTVGFWDGFWERRNGLGAAPVYTDPDSASETLRNYHQALWSRKLPNGEVMTLQKGKKSDYLTWNGMRFASDSIATQHRYIKCEHVIRQVESQMPNYRSFVYDTTRFTYTIGGMIIFPKLRGSMNQDRGTNPMIADRCIEVEDVSVLRLFSGLPEKLIVKNTDRFMVDENFFIRPGMKYIEICEENEFYKTIDGIVYTKDGKTLLKCPRNHPGKVAVPDGVEVIAESAFEDTSITDIVLPDSLREIERMAFFDCSKLKSVDFGHGLESIGDMSHDSKTFESCFSLRELKLPPQMKTIGRGVFKNCGIEKLELNEGLEDIGSNAFLYCKNIKEVTLPDSLKSLGENNFLNAEVVHTKHVLKNLVRAVSDVTFNDYNNVCTVALDIDGKLIYLPRHLPIEYVSEAQNIIEQKKDWYYGMLFSMSPDINSKNETAICAYMNGDHNRILDEYVKSRADWIAKYLVDVNKTERLVKFLKTGLVSEMMAKYLIEEYNKRPVLNSDDVIAKAYLLQAIGESEQEKNIESDLEL